MVSEEGSPFADLGSPYRDIEGPLFTQTTFDPFDDRPWHGRHTHIEWGSRDKPEPFRDRFHDIGLGSEMSRESRLFSPRRRSRLFSPQSELIEMPIDLHKSRPQAPPPNPSDQPLFQELLTPKPPPVVLPLEPELPPSEPPILPIYAIPQVPKGKLKRPGPKTVPAEPPNPAMMATTAAEAKVLGS